MRSVEFGMTACYIHDYGFDYLMDIPGEAALAWAKQATPDSVGNAGTVQFKEMTIPEQWLNKLFVVVNGGRDGWIALYNHDGKFSIRQKLFEDSDPA